MAPLKTTELKILAIPQHVAMNIVKNIKKAKPQKKLRKYFLPFSILIWEKKSNNTSLPIPQNPTENGGGGGAAPAPGAGGGGGGREGTKPQGKNTNKKKTALNLKIVEDSLL